MTSNKAGQLLGFYQSLVCHHTCVCTVLCSVL